MAVLNIESTEDTPKVIFDPANNNFELSGRSLPEDAPSFYGPMLEWLDEYYGGSPLPSTIFDFKLEYFNTASSKLILDVLMKLEEHHSAGNATTIRWHYDEDDEDMQEAGEEFADLVDVTFEHVEQ